MPLERITIFCFGASYALALLFELVHLLWPRPIHRLTSLGFGAAGLVAHTLYLAFHPTVFSSQSGTCLLLSWILAVFYLYGAIHHGKLVWGAFVLPLVLALTGFAWFDAANAAAPSTWSVDAGSIKGPHFWRMAHYALLLMAAVGVCVGFVASVMYLFQASRLKAKLAPGQGLRLLSLERLEAMNKKAIILAFPLLTAGVVVGVVLMLQRQTESPADPVDPKIVGTGLLWIVFALLLYLRYGFHLRGRRLSILTIIAFILLLLTLASSHTSVSGGRP